MPSQIKELEERLQRRDKKIAGLNADLRNANDSSKDLKDEISELKAKLDDANASSKELKDEISELEAELDDANASSKELKDEISELEAELDDANASSKELKHQIAKHLRLIHDTNASSHILENQLSKRNSALKKSNAELKKAKANVNALNDKIADLKAQVAQGQEDLEGDRAKSSKTILGLQNEVASLKSELENQLSKRNGELGKCDADLENADADVAAVNDKIADLKAQVARGREELEADRVNSSETIGGLRNQVAHLEDEVSRSKDLEQQCEGELKAGHTNIAALNETIANHLEAQVAQEKADLEDAVAHSQGDPEVTDSTLEEGEEVDDELQRAIYDKLEDVERCVKCSWEVIEGVCEACEKEHIFVEDDEDDIGIAYDSDREQAPRGDTPLLPITRVHRPVEGYTNEEYTALLERGATRRMIRTFNLEFSNERGIFAWADHDLYAEFAGPKMLKGDFWKIQLGRRFELDGDDDDGSEFIEALLEETILYPSPGGNKWETVEETPGIWVTRMVANGDGAEDEEDEEGGDDDDDDNGPDVSNEEQAVLRCPGYDTAEDELLPGESTASDDVVKLNDPAVVFQIRAMQTMSRESKAQRRKSKAQRRK